MFNEKYIQPMCGQLDDIVKQKQLIDNSIEEIYLQILADKFDGIEKLLDFPIERLVSNIGPLLASYHYYLIKVKKESDIFKSLFDKIFNYIIEAEYNLINSIRSIKLAISQVTKSLTDYSTNLKMVELINSWNEYLLDKLTDIEKINLRVEFRNISTDTQQLIYDLAELEYIAQEMTATLDESSLGFTIKNFGIIAKNLLYDAQRTGNFKALRPGLLKLVNRCKKEKDIRGLLKDSYYATSQLGELGENKPNIRKECNDHIKWIESIYRPAIKNKLKELKEKNRLDESSEILDEGLKDAIMKTKANIKVADRKASDKIDSIADKIFGEVKSAKTEEERERIIRNSIPKASFVIKKVIKNGLLFLVNPVIALINVLTSIAVNKRTREVQRKLILNELQTELKIVEEKIKDAESDNDKKKKYELMRIQAKLEKDIERIRYNLKY